MRSVWKTLFILAAMGVLLSGIAVVTGCNDSTDYETFNISMTSLDTYDPQAVTGHVGALIVWTNDDTDPHTVLRDPQNAVAIGPNSDAVLPNGIAPGESFSWLVPNVPSGTVFYYHCRFHGAAGDGSSVGTGMAGLIEVD